MKVIVTGAGSGIGRGVAQRLAAAGSHQMLLVDRNEEGLRATAESIAGAKATILTADVSKTDCGDVIVKSAVEAMGGVDWLVSNAGIFRTAALAEMPVEDFDSVMAINTRATWLIAKAAYPHLQASVNAAIVATASVSAYHPSPPLGIYSASKAALIMLMRQLANEWGPDGIRCNTVSPAATISGMIPAAMLDPKVMADREAASPLRRVNRPEDVADVILFLLSDAARNVTGVDIPVDSGVMLTLVSGSGVGPGRSLDQQNNQGQSL